LTERVTAGFVGSKGLSASGAATALTPREEQVLRLIAAGYGNKEIGVQLELSAKTVDAHKSNAMRKLDMRGRIDVVKYAVLRGWLDQS
jgi:two-component system response regulator NreC